jgi:hypothetical protein
MTDPSFEIRLSGFPAGTTEPEIRAHLQTFCTVMKVQLAKEPKVGSARAVLRYAGKPSRLIAAINGEPFNGHSIRAKPSGGDQTKPSFQRAPMLFENADVPIPMHPQDFNFVEERRRHSHEERHSHLHHDRPPPVPWM